jgi:Zn-dependent peptidase ImmA (M78 family)
VARRAEWSEPLVRRLIEQAGGLRPEEIVERYADDLREKASQDRFPIRTDLIASVHGIKRRRAQQRFAGRIYAEPSGQLVMDVNTQDSEERQHFTEAHELIHPAFPGFETEERYRLDTSMDRYAENREEEYLCDVGAAALLMPKELVAEHYTVRGGLMDVERLSHDAEVSIETAANRVVALADEPAVMLCLAWSHKPADRIALRKGEEVPKALRVRYAVTSHLNVYIPRFKGAGEQSVLCEAAEGSQTASATQTLPGAQEAGPFRIQAKRYGAGERERVLALARPTA